jgi:hypothetical protein
MKLEFRNLTKKEIEALKSNNCKVVYSENIIRQKIHSWEMN